MLDTESYMRRQQKEIEREAYPFTVQGQTIFPVDWCADAIAIGKRENIADKYMQFILRLRA